VTTITLYSKPGCHLCEEARALLDELGQDLGFAIEEIDITTDAALFARYRYEIPVVMKDGVELARGRVSERELVDALRATSP
jgi:glutaredoxin